MTDDWGAVQALVERLQDVVVPSISTTQSDISYPWVSLPLNEFLAGMKVAQQYLIDRNKCWGEHKFLDVGSGIGTKMHLAYSLGWNPSGIELRQPYITTSKWLFPEFPVELTDAHDYDKYAEYDLIYMYRPCIDLEDQRRLTNYIISLMKPDTLLFIAGGPDPHLKEIGQGVWLI